MLDFPGVTAMHARVNPFFVPGRVAHEPRDAVRAFHRGLPGYAPTPLHRLDGLARALGVGALRVKDESYRFGLNAFKGLGAAWALHRIREHRAGPFTVSTATAGNHGRAVAWAARQLGLPAVVFVPDKAAPARIESIRREGARVELVAGSYEDAVRRSAETSAGLGWQVVADVGYDGYLEIPHWIAEGYSTLFAETDEQLAREGAGGPDVVLVQAGVGGLLQAAVDHYRAKASQPMLGAVEPAEADALFASINTPDGDPVPSRGRQDSIMAGLNCHALSLSAWPVVRRGVELFLTVEDRYAEAAMRRLARPEPGDPAITAGESGAAGLAGLLALLEAPELAAARGFLHLGPASRVLLINTEGATDPEGYRRVVGEPTSVNG